MMDHKFNDGNVDLTESTMFTTKKVSLQVKNE